MLPRGAAVSILAVGSVTAILGGGYLLQQQATDMSPSEFLDEAEQPPVLPNEPGIPTDGSDTASTSPRATNRPPEPSVQPKEEGPSERRPDGGPRVPPQPQAQSAMDRLLEMLGRNSASPAGSPTGGPPPLATGVPPPPLGTAPTDKSPAVPAENFGPTANPREGYREVIVPGGLIVEVVLVKDLSSAEAKVEAPVEARITRSYRVGDDLAVPENTRLVGLVTAVAEEGAIKGRGRIDFRFYRLRLPDGSVVAIETPVQRYEGPAPAGKAAKKAGGAALGGAVVGILLGGASGAVKGAAAGAAAATADAVTKGEPEPVVIPADVPFDLRIVSSIRVHLPIKGRP